MPYSSVAKHFTLVNRHLYVDASQFTAPWLRGLWDDSAIPMHLTKCDLTGCRRLANGVLTRALAPIIHQLTTLCLPEATIDDSTLRSWLDAAQQRISVKGIYVGGGAGENTAQSVASTPRGPAALAVQVCWR